MSYHSLPKATRFKPIFIVDVCEKANMILAWFAQVKSCLEHKGIKCCIFRQEMSHKAKEQSDNLDSDVFPTSPMSDKSNSPTMPLSPTSTLSSTGKRKNRKTSDKGYSSTNSSLSESGKRHTVVISILLSL